MTGRVKRLLALAEAEERATRAAAAPLACALCGRALGRQVEWHHVVPKSAGGRETVPLHPICHRAIHAALPNVELARAGTIAAIRAEPAIARFLSWVEDKPPDFHAPTRRGR